MLTLYAHDNGIGVLHVSPRGRGGGRGREGRRERWEVNMYVIGALITTFPLTCTF